MEMTDHAYLTVMGKMAKKYQKELESDQDGNKQSTD
jgi:hypothetical protein